MRRTSLLMTAVLAVSLAACSGGTEPDATESAASADGEVTFVGTEAVQWAQSTKDAVALDGSLAVTLTCEGAVPHNLVIEGVQDDAEIASCDGNDSSTATVAIEPGTYTYYCAVTGHQAAGMEGTLSVS